MEIYFNITEDAVNNMAAIDYEAFERAQDGEFKLYRLRPALCRFMVDKDNKPMSYEQALKISEKMKIKEVKDFIGKFFETMSNNAVPKGNGNLSSQPSEAPPAVSEFPTG